MDMLLHVNVNIVENTINFDKNMNRGLAVINVESIVVEEPDFSEAEITRIKGIVKEVVCVFLCL